MAKILLVDDEVEILSFVSELLEDGGFEVRKCSDSREAVAVFESFCPDVCFLDFNMPHLTGAEVLTRFKAIDPSVEVVFLTAQSETLLVIDLMKHGAIDYLLKPVTFHELRAALDRALEHRRLIQENTAYRMHLETLVLQKTEGLNQALLRLENLNSAILETLGMALDYRDQSTSGHSRRVANWTVGIARRIGVPGDALVQVEQGALLHDIGKLKTPDGVLLKPGPLNREEWAIMRRHPQHGREFLENIEFLRSAAEIVYAHHERFDGSGYPRGLRSDAIPIGARCFAIVDAVDAMTFQRPYNQPIPFERAAAEVLRCAGTHFDPDLTGIATDFLSEYFTTPK